ncbi:hypothetical protein [Luminiphilus sp. nBUS_07]|uniref:hypothetical protein n=1 Tax=Luminiphilus sp. nBUS_07 TaxID=3395314 RepID=UPI003EB96A61
MPHTPGFTAKLRNKSQRLLSNSTERSQFCVLFVVLAMQILVPLNTQELYPFSAATMFAYPLKQVALYEVRDPAGFPLSQTTFGLQISNPHDPPVTTLGRLGYGRQSPGSIQQPNNQIPYGAVATKLEVTRQIESQLLKMRHLPYVVVTQSVLGPVDGYKVGIARRNTWKIANTRFTQP